MTKESQALFRLAVCCVCQLWEKQSYQNISIIFSFIVAAVSPTTTFKGGLQRILRLKISNNSLRKMNTGKEFSIGFQDGKLTPWK